MPVRLALLIVALTPALGVAAPLQLKSQCQAGGGLVRLGDLVEIAGEDAAAAPELAALDLFPAPAAGEKKSYTARQIQDMLELHGLGTAQYPLRGASNVVVTGARKDATAAAPRRSTAQPASGPAKAHTFRQSTPPEDVEAASSKVRQAIAAYLASQPNGRQQQWQVDLHLPREQVAVFAPATGELAVSGGDAPWTGPQRFTVTLSEGKLRRKFAVEAEISAAATIVVAAESLARGTILRASDVKLQMGQAASGSGQAFSSIDEVIGKEVTRAISAGQILNDQIVRRPLLVRRTEIVSVYARAAGVQVRTTARAREDGSQGDLVTVESIGERRAFFARVCGPQEVEVLADSVSVAETAAPVVREEPARVTMRDAAALR